MIVFLKNLINRLSINNSIVNINNRNIKIAVNDWMQNAEKAEAKYGHISNWNTSKVTTMKKLFFKVPLFNQPIGDWDVSNVTDMSYMFRNDGMDIGSAFNQPIGNWDLSNVNNISFMFYDAITFNQNLSNWDIKNIRNHFSFSFNTPNWLLSKPI